MIGYDVFENILQTDDKKKYMETLAYSIEIGKSY